MKTKYNGLALVCGLLLLSSGCHSKTNDSTGNFTTAINNYYLTRPACLWSAPKKFPVQVDTKDAAETSGYDALVDQGLLTRTTAEKKKMIVMSEQVTDYDFSDKGRSAWTPDTQQPGFGNFCYGKWTASSIDHYTQTTDKPGATSTVNYHANISDAPAWATAAETQNAFPQIKAALAGSQPEVATLTDFQNGWAVTTGPKDSNMHPVTAADGSVVE